MDACSTTALCAYTSAIELAFATNLFIAAWAGVYDRLGSRLKDISARVDELERDPHIQEELSIERLRNTIRRCGSTQRVLWWCGLTSGIVSATILHTLLWHFSPDTEIGRWWWGLMVINYLSPSVMLAMTSTGSIGHRLAVHQQKKLKDHAKKKQLEAAANMKKATEDAGKYMQPNPERPK